MAVQFALRVISLLAGISIIWMALTSAVRTFILPRSAQDPIIYFVFRTLMRRIFNLRTRLARNFLVRDRIMAMYAPVTLLMLPVVWLTMVLIGYMGIFWALDERTFAGGSWQAAFNISGSSLLTLGFATTPSFLATILTFSEAIIGLILLSLLIAYLPTMYAAFSKRESAVTMLEVRAGSPPSAMTLITRFFTLKRTDHLHDLWESWEAWFVHLEESHTSLAALAFYRSPQPHRSWVTAAGTVLDSAAIMAAMVDITHDSQIDLTIRAGYLALRHIADFFHLSYDPIPKATDPIAITRAEFETMCDELVAGGVPLKADREQGWHAYAGWRVNYDTVLLALAQITMAPEAPWTSDRLPLTWRKQVLVQKQ